MVHLDFEKAAHNAVLEVFENCQVVNCRFHLSQALFRRIKNNKELNKHYAGKTVVDCVCIGTRRYAPRRRRFAPHKSKISPDLLCSTTSSRSQDQQKCISVATRY
ncbi:Uncharacterized protein FWK35_00029965 [Aphis craccivora]|uniref:MULE domain-containing protein n=1 Tax=Aphis craccivora TaxID=307492 RepID=A0A6G0Y2C9_APHCR|nr:Uncharacterized protein FWK35_00029965 [Aphis craccivora]